MNKQKKASVILIGIMLLIICFNYFTNDLIIDFIGNKANRKLVNNLEKYFSNRAINNLGNFYFTKNSINNIIDYCVDNEGNFYYLDYQADSTVLYKVTQTGKIIIKEKLPKMKKNLIYNYKQIIVDKAENIYLLTTARDIKKNKVVLEAVEKYNSKGKRENNVYELFLENNIKQENSFVNINNRLQNIQYINENLYIIDRKSSQEMDLIEITLDSQQPDISKKKSINFTNSIQLTEIIYTNQDEFYIVNRRAEIYRVHSNGRAEKIDTSYHGFTKVIPNTISTDKYGHLYFTDIYNKNFVKYNSFTKQINVVYDYSFKISQEKNVNVENIRKIKVTGTNQIVGQSKIGNSGYKFIANINNDNGKLIDNIYLPAYQRIIQYFMWLAMAALVVMLGYYIKKRFTGKINLITKQMLIFIPIFLFLMSGMVFILIEMTANSTNNIAYSRINTIAKVTADLMNGEIFNSLNFPRDDFSEEYLQIQQQVDLDVDDLYYVTYFSENEDIYVGVSKSIQSCTPIDYLYDQDTVDIYEECIETGQPQQGTTIDSYGEWMFSLAPIKDNHGNTVGILEIGMDKELTKTGIVAATKKIAFFILVITLIVVLAYLLMLKYSLKSLNVLKTAVTEIAAGKWNAKVDINTKDEFNDIGYAFNKMSDYIQDYVQEITKLNNAYIKFVPEEFFAFLNKKNVLEVKLGDQALQQTSIMYINIRDFYKKSRTMNTQENFNYLNSIFATIAEVINDNGGIIERFEGSGVIAIFKENTNKAVIAGLKIMEKLGSDNMKNKVDLGISIHYGEIMLGIVGHQERLATSLISEEVNNTLLIEKLSSKFGTKLLLTDTSLSSLNKQDNYSYRYVGKIMENYNKKIINLYEFLDGDVSKDKNAKIITKERFEKGIAYYQAGKFFEARKKFIEVIRENGNDKLAKTYLFLCEKYNGQEMELWEGVLEYL